ncbi:MAG: tetratricopeptide repeat protein [Promethearchaeota archaeon]
MLHQFPEELIRVSELIDQVSFEEALEIIEELEKDESLSPKDQVSVILMKGRIYHYSNQFEKQVKVYRSAYQISRNLGMVPESIEALIGRAFIVFTGDFIKAPIYVKKAEKILNSLAYGPIMKILRRKLLFIKSWILPFTGAVDEAVECAKEALKLAEEEHDKLGLSTIYNRLGWLETGLGNQENALDYAQKGLQLNKELNYKIGISRNYSLLARIYYNKQDYERSFHYCEEALLFNELGHWPKIEIISILADIHYFKTEINKAIKYQQQALSLSEESNVNFFIVNNLVKMGYFYKAAGKNNLVITNIEKALILSEKLGFPLLTAVSITLLILSLIEEKSLEKANQYFSRLTELYEESMKQGDLDVTIYFLVSKAYILKASTRMRDRVEAQTLFKEANDRMSPEGDIFSREMLIFSMGNLCDLLLEELSIYNDPKVLDEILPIIKKSQKFAEETHNYAWLTNTKLLQAKLALIQMKIEDAKKLMVEAQRIADDHGFDLLAWGISTEHDKLLDQIDVWNKIQKDESSIGDRIKLASTRGVLERLQGRSSIDSPGLVNEEPILLLIMDDTGATYFNHPFVANWDHSDLFSQFMSAFNTFSSEMFSKSIDRIRIGENTILINPIDPFLACYVIKGQSYPAWQKLTRFTKTIRENSIIWQALNKSIKTSEMIELDNPPILRGVVNEIFIQQS